LRIREATPEDAAAIAAGMKVVVDEGVWLARQPSTTESDLHDRFAASIAAGDLLLVLEDGTRIVGCTGLRPTAVDGVWSLGTWLLPGYRGRGHGRKLLDSALAAGMALGVRKIGLEAFTDNGAAIALYSAAGFEIEGTKRDHYPREDGSIKSAVMMAWFAPAGGR
jgi:[ribosomal protein S18]-alanine N-acetyltransferase